MTLRDQKQIEEYMKDAYLAISSREAGPKKLLLSFLSADAMYLKKGSYGSDLVG